MLPHHLVNLKNDISQIYDFSNQNFMIIFFYSSQWKSGSNDGVALMELKLNYYHAF